MNFILSGKNIDITDALRERVESKLGKLNKFFDANTDANITLSVEKNDQIVEVTVPFKGMIFRAEKRQNDMYASIDGVVDILERKIIKNKTRLQRTLNKGVPLKFEDLDHEFEDEDDENQITKIKRFTMKPMSSDEAILQMNLLGHDFFMFMNSDTDNINVIYKRKDSNYGLIEPTE